jgi:hypothetical protein
MAKRSAETVIKEEISFLKKLHRTAPQNAAIKQRNKH